MNNILSYWFFPSSYVKCQKILSEVCLKYKQNVRENGSRRTKWNNVRTTLKTIQVDFPRNSVLWRYHEEYQVKQNVQR